MVASLRRPPPPSSRASSRRSQATVAGGDAGGGDVGASGATTAPSPAGALVERPARGAPDLFARAALAAALDRGGARGDRRAAGPLDEAAGRARARSGQVDPAWRDLERSIDARFVPTLDDVTSQPAGALLAAQLRAGFRHADEIGRADRHHLDSTGSAGDWFALDDKLRAEQAHFADAAEWRSAEVEVLVDADGALLELRLVCPSGRARLDAVALAAVRQAVARRPPRAGPGRTRARFVVAAAATVTPPELMTGAGGLPAAVVNLLTLKLDESTATLRAADHPLHVAVATRVTLSYLAPEP